MGWGQRHKVYRTRDEARADVFDYIDTFYNAVRQHSTIGYVSPVEFERQVGLAGHPQEPTALADFVIHWLIGARGG